MFRLFGIVFVTGLAIAIAWWLAGIPGTATAEIAGLTIEAPVPLAIVALLILFAIVYGIARCLGAIVRIPMHMRRRAETSRRASGDQAVTRTLLALASGDGMAARREARRSRKLLGDTPNTLLLAAQAGRVAGDEAEAAAVFRELAVRDDAAFLGWRGLLRQAIAREDWAQAAELARKAEIAHPGALWLRSERAHLALRTGAWRDALALAEPDAPRGAIAAAAAAAEADPAEARRLAKQAFDADPALPAATIAFARRLRDVGRERRAQTVLRAGWAANPHPDIADFALAPITDPMERLRAGETFVRDTTGKGESRFLMAKLAHDAGRNADAMRYGEMARAAGFNQRRLWVLLSDIAEAEGGETDAGREAQRTALRHLADAEPDPAWQCAQCGTVHGSWHPVCPACHTAGRISWTVPGGRRELLALPDGARAWPE